jgi:hypothetical protein
MVERFANIADGLSYRTPLPDLVVKMKSMAASGDLRTLWGHDIARCLLHNGADRLRLLGEKIDVRPWRGFRELVRDAWSVFRGSAVAIYVKGGVYDLRHGGLLRR